MEEWRRHQHSCEQDLAAQMQYNLGEGAEEEENLKKKKNLDSEKILENHEFLISPPAD